MNLSSASGTSFLIFDQQTCHYHEIVGNHGGSHQQFESLTTLGQTALHAATAEENGDAPLDAGPKALGTLEGWTLLNALLSWRFLPTTLGDRHDLDASVFALPDIVWAEKSPIGTVDSWRIIEYFLVTLQRRCHVKVIGGIAIQHAILTDQAVGTYGDEDFVTELDRFEDFASFDQVGVGFED